MLLKGWFTIDCERDNITLHVRLRENFFHDCWLSIFLQAGSMHAPFNGSGLALFAPPPPPLFLMVRDVDNVTEGRVLPCRYAKHSIR